MELKLAYGAVELLPADAPAAWGARLIVKQDGYVDLVPDRQDAAGPDDERKALLAHLNSLGDAGPLKVLSRKLKDYEVRTREEGEVLLYEDAKIIVKGDTHASCGYFYIVAYPRPEVPGIVLPRKGTEPGYGAGAPVWLKLIWKVLDGPAADIFKLITVAANDEGHCVETYERADVVFPTYDEDIVYVIPKDEGAAAVIEATLAELEEAA